jgi:hypothetical protein
MAYFTASLSALFMGKYEGLRSDLFGAFNFNPECLLSFSKKRSGRQRSADVTCFFELGILLNFGWQSLVAPVSSPVLENGQNGYY